MEETAVMMTGLNYKNVLNCLNVLEDQCENKNKVLNIVEDYKCDNFSEKILRIMSYTHMSIITYGKIKTKNENFSNFSIFLA